MNRARVLGMAYLAILELELQDHLGALDCFLDDLGSNPALGGIGLPCSCADIVGFRHDGRWGAGRALLGCLGLGADGGGLALSRDVGWGLEEGGRHDYLRLGRDGFCERKDIHQD